MEGLDALPPDSLPAGGSWYPFVWSWWWSMLCPLQPWPVIAIAPSKWGPASRLGWVLSKERRGDDMDGMAD